LPRLHVRPGTIWERRREPGGIAAGEAPHGRDLQFAQGVDSVGRDGFELVYSAVDGEWMVRRDVSNPNLRACGRLGTFERKTVPFGIVRPGVVPMERSADVAFPSWVACMLASFAEQSTVSIRTGGCIDQPVVR